MLTWEPGGVGVTLPASQPLPPLLSAPGSSPGLPQGPGDVPSLGRHPLLLTITRHLVFPLLTPPKPNCALREGDTPSCSALPQLLTERLLHTRHSVLPLHVFFTKSSRVRGARQKTPPNRRTAGGAKENTSLDNGVSEVIII